MLEDWHDHVYLRSRTHKEFTGALRGVEFIKGKSVYPVSQKDIEPLASGMLVVIKDENGDEMAVGSAAALMRANQRHKREIKESKNGKSTIRSGSADSKSENEATGQGLDSQLPAESEQRRDSGNTESVGDVQQAGKSASVQGLGLALTDAELTADVLAGIADKHGLPGLREIGDVRDIKARSIAQLIDELVEYRERKEAAADK